MVRSRSVIAGAAVLAVVAGVGLALPPLSLLVDEAAVPPASALPALPDGAHLAAEGMGCGSGGCWLELTVEAAEGMTGDELARAIVPDDRACAFRGPVDLRRVCTGVIDTDADSTRFFVQYERWVD
ncbi:hypothetical protein [Myceligenerans pegani]|uniref:Uncharacterized protein n=1 Tax=Myceligenerans pegani TaxID=2776917 RepID=A0ABR9N345_9MICO|nr:hypothetical protein [Myceligenerans sp. TRM 65318]MBE1878074.1 hypothetical protein [Myceligenerans sp. TRM 65318]MBE3020345.1 hypothetical protein [Myceligenerans sp. TRM 65318]